MILSKDGERHRAMRKMFARHIGTRETVSEYHDLQEVEAKRFLVSACGDPEHILKHVRLYVGMSLRIHQLNVVIALEAFQPCFSESPTDTISSGRPLIL